MPHRYTTKKTKRQEAFVVHQAEKRIFIWKDSQIGGSDPPVKARARV